MKARALFVLWILMLVMLACNLPMTKGSGTGTVTPTGALDILTLAAQTAAVGQAQSALTLTPGVNTPGAAPATSAAAATNTPVPPTAAALPCDRAAFIQDVTVPDGTKMLPGQAFTKTWRLQNTGTCTWNTSYALVFSSGDAMGAPAVVNLPGNVPPNSTVDLSIDMKAPITPGSYTSNWKLRNSTGVIFGVNGDGKIFVKIEVTPPTSTPTITPTVTNTPTITPTPTVTLTPTLITPQANGVYYDFTANMCHAEWRSESGVLTCPGTTNDIRGYAQSLQNLKLEDGVTQPNPVLLTVPNSTKTGAITGTYPAIYIQTGYHFQASIGCVFGQNQCSVIYQVNFVVDNGQPANLKNGTHTYNGKLDDLDIDLSSLSGKSIQIVLAVLANGSSTDDQAVWVNPRIVKP